MSEADVVRACLAPSLPEGYRNPGPRIDHLLAKHDGSLEDLVGQHTGLDQASRAT